MKSKKVVLAVLMLSIFATNNYLTDKYNNYPRVGISVGWSNDSTIDVEYREQRKEFNMHDLREINNFAGKYFTFVI